MYNDTHLVSRKMLLFKGLPCLDRTGVALLKLRRHGGILGGGKGRQTQQREGGREKNKNRDRVI